jgi:hypothetical protein
VPVVVTAATGTRRDDGRGSMLEFLTGVVVLLIVVSAAHLLLTFGLVRRLRELQTRLTALATSAPDVMTLGVGDRIPQYAGLSVDGPALWGFFSPQCDACHERIPDFRAAADAHHGSVVAVVVRDGGDVDALVAELDGADRDGRRVVVEEPGGPMTGAFGVHGFPAFAFVDPDGTVRYRGFDLPRPAPA